MIKDFFKPGRLAALSVILMALSMLIGVFNMADIVAGHIEMPPICKVLFMTSVSLFIVAVLRAGKN